MGTSVKVGLAAALCALVASGCVTTVDRRSGLQPNAVGRSFVSTAISRTVLIKLSCDVPYTALVVGADGIPKIVKGVRKTRGHASGVILSSTKGGLSYVLTAAHVLKPTLKYKCTVTAHRATGLDAYKAPGVPLTTVSVSKDVDLAVASTPAYFGVSTRIASTAQVGDSITVVGFPAAYNDSYIENYGLTQTVSVTTGVIATILNRDGKAHDLRLTSPIYFGNSGGPVFDARGDVVGVAVSFYGIRIPGAGSMPYPAGYFAVPYHEIRVFLAQAGLAHLLK